MITRIFSVSFVSAIFLMMIAFIVTTSTLHAKELVCHNGKTLSVSINALDGHLIHGDSLGACDEVATDDDDDIIETTYTCECPPGISQCTCADGTTGNPSTAAATAAGISRIRSLYGY